MEKMKRAAITIATAVAALLALTASAPAAPLAAPLTPGSRYLALGDSVTFGYQESAVKPTPDYKHQASFLGYPELIARELRVTVTNAACPGETSASLIDAHALSNGCENVLGKGSGYRTLFPLHAHYTGSQLAFAVSYLRAHRDVRLVSLMIGANDLFACQETMADKCLSASEQQSALAKVKANIRHILSAIRNRAHYTGQLVILNYYSLNYGLPAYNHNSQELNRAQDSAARPFRVKIADGYGQFERAARTFGSNTCTAGLLTQWGPPVMCGVHPSYGGQTLLAAAVLSATRL